MVGVGRYTADAKEDQGFQAAGILIRIPYQGKVIVVGFAAGRAAGRAVRNQPFFFFMNLLDQAADCFLVEIYVGDGGKKPFDQNPVSAFCGKGGIFAGPGQADESAGQLILKLCHGGGFSADSGLSCAAGAPGCLFTLKTKHLFFHRCFSFHIIRF